MKRALINTVRIVSAILLPLGTLLLVLLVISLVSADNMSPHALFLYSGVVVLLFILPLLAVLFLKKPLTHDRFALPGSHGRTPCSTDATSLLIQRPLKNGTIAAILIAIGVIPVLFILFTL